MMPTQSALLTSVTADGKKGRRFVELCRAQYNKAGLDEKEAQELNEHPGFAAYLAAGIRKFSAIGPVFPVYLEIEVGGKTKNELLAELQSNGFFVSERAKDIMSKNVWRSGEKRTVKFGRATLRELGFTNPKKLPTTREIWARIQELGHNLCEPGDGPAIRRNLRDQPCGDHFWIAMEQILDSGGFSSVFYVHCHGDGEPWLHTVWVIPGSKWNLERSVVFRLRK